MEPINTSSIISFIEQIKVAEASNQSEIRLNIRQARIISNTLAQVLAKLNADIETIMQENSNDQKITISMDGNTW